MQLELIIAQLRALCPSLNGRVAGAAEFKPVSEAAALPVPCAFVIPLDDRPEPPKVLNAVGQEMTDSFGVIVALDNRADEKGQNGAASFSAVRSSVGGLIRWALTLTPSRCSAKACASISWYLAPPRMMVRVTPVVSEYSSTM